MQFVKLSKKKNNTMTLKEIELIKLEAIQKYLLDHGANNEDINDAILVLKGLKTQEQVNIEKARRYNESTT
jgi:hypothetical protein